MTLPAPQGRPLPPAAYVAGAIAVVVPTLTALFGTGSTAAVRALLLLAGLAAGALLLAAHRGRSGSSGADEALEDPATGLPSGRFVRAFLETQVGAARRGHSLSVALFGLHGFEGIDGRARRRLLGQVGRVFRENLREMNVAGHLGGGRFLAVLAHEARAGTSVFADRVLRGVDRLGADDGLEPSASAGVAGFSRDVTDGEELIARAGEALERARELGRGHVILYGDDAYRVGPVQPHFSPRESAEARPAGPESSDAPGGALRDDDTVAP